MKTMHRMGALLIIGLVLAAGDRAATIAAVPDDLIDAGCSALVIAPTAPDLEGRRKALEALARATT
jgi:hypothetical protein